MHLLQPSVRWITNGRVNGEECYAGLPAEPHGGKMATTAAQVIEKIREDLAWRSPNGKKIGHIFLPREEAELLVQTSPPESEPAPASAGCDSVHSRGMSTAIWMAQGGRL